MKKTNLTLVLVLAGLLTGPWVPTASTAGQTPFNRVVSSGPLITDMIYQLGADPQLAGVTSYCTIPEGKQSKQIIGTVIQINVEQIVRLQPDAVFASTLTRIKQVQSLRNQGLQVIQFDNPPNFDTLCSMLLDLGTLLGRKQAALDIVEAAAARVDLIRETVQNLEKRKVFIQIGIKPLKTAEQGTFINDYIELAGGINIAGHTGSGIFSREHVLKENPDVIFVATMGTATKAGIAEKAAWMKFAALNAVKNNEVYVLADDSVFSPTPMTFARTLMLFFSHIHPEAAENLTSGRIPTEPFHE